MKLQWHSSLQWEFHWLILTWRNEHVVTGTQHEKEYTGES